MVMVVLPGRRPALSAKAFAETRSPFDLLMDSGISTSPYFLDPGRPANMYLPLSTFWTQVKSKAPAKTASTKLCVLFGTKFPYNPISTLPR